jgi:hypothetical protein
MSSTLTALTEATTFATTDEGYAVVSGNSRSYTFSTLGKLFGNGSLPFAVGTITTSQPLTVTQTWTASGVVFDGLKLTVTATAQADQSRGIVSEIAVGPPINVSHFMARNTNALGQTRYRLYNDSGTTATDGATLFLMGSSVGGGYANAFGVWNYENGEIIFASNNTETLRIAANVVSQINSTTAQTFRVYRTFTDSSNYERLALQHGAGYVELAAETAGSGTANINIRLIPAGGGTILMRSTFGIMTGAGVGGTVTQTTSKSTGVTLNKVCGQITMHNAALAANAVVAFDVSNNTIAATDVIIINHSSGGTPSHYAVGIAYVTTGGFGVWVQNQSIASQSDAVVLNFLVIKSVNS